MKQIPHTIHKYGFPIYTGDTNDFFVQEEIRKHGVFEADICNWIDNNISENSIVYDIGSNVGEISEMAAYKGAKVYAFDAQKDLCKIWALLRKECKIKNDVTIFNVALSDHFETLLFYKSNVNVGGSTFSKNFVSKIEPESFIGATKKYMNLVPLSSLDLPDSIPDLIKIDIQGFESKVWDGMTESMKKAKNVIVEMYIGDVKDSYRYFDYNRKAYDMQENLLANNPEELYTYFLINLKDQYINILFHE